MTLLTFVLINKFFKLLLPFMLKSFVYWSWFSDNFIVQIWQSSFTSVAIPEIERNSCQLLDQDIKVNIYLTLSYKEWSNINLNPSLDKKDSAYIILNPPTLLEKSSIFRVDRSSSNRSCFSGLYCTVFSKDIWPVVVFHRFQCWGTFHLCLFVIGECLAGPGAWMDTATVDTAPTLCPAVQWQSWVLTWATSGPS